MKRITLLGVSIHTGIGVWHFFVPTLYGWNDYLSAVPSELVNGIMATNFFFSLLMTLVGVLALLHFFRHWDEPRTTRAFLILLSVLWVVRVIYQALQPQGTMIPGLSVVLLLVFIMTAVLFVIPTSFLGGSKSDQQ
ncbi:hypothetical protein EU545_04955 [Candidatus Thorarchaeota archaeon]|nr:MAG: hypothetical protein EU545_04955 [Candidatus Thorarchaeota archaeon]